MKTLAKYFFNGILVVVPLAATVYILFSVCKFIGEIPGMEGPKGTAAGFVIVIGGTTFVGFLASHFFTSKLFGIIDLLFQKLPLVKLLYSSIKDLIGAFVGEKKKFDKPVLVSFLPGNRGKAIGFITRESLECFGMAEEVAVYFPQSFNFAGNLLVFPNDQISPLDAPSSEVMAFIVSGGISGSGEGNALRGSKV